VWIGFAVATTGWFPTVPIGFFLCVAREVWIWDIVPFLRRDRLNTRFAGSQNLIKSKGLAGHFQALPERLSRLREVLALCEQPEGLGPAELLEWLGIRYWIGSASRSGLPP